MLRRKEEEEDNCSVGGDDDDANVCACNYHQHKLRRCIRMLEIKGSYFFTLDKPRQPCSSSSYNTLTPLQQLITSQVRWRVSARRT